MTEAWGYIPDVDNRYQVSTSGNARSVDYVKIDSRGRCINYKGKPLTPSVNHGYHRISMRLPNGKNKSMSVHRAMAITFLGGDRAGIDVCHKDDVRDNNILPNLKWGTRIENMADQRRNGHNFWLNQETCKRRHPLIGANVVPSKVLLGHRQCLACSRAESYVRYPKNAHLDVGELANMYFKQLDADVVSLEDTA